MLHWLVGSCRVLGLDGQNWMLVIAGALGVYAAALLLIRRRRQRGW
jgi:LPXTG-motif cell wall-anchored protein